MRKEEGNEGHGLGFELCLPKNPDNHLADSPLASLRC